MNFIDKMVERFIKLNRRMKRWQRVVSVMAAVVVFATTYALILPAITLDRDTATAEPGIEVAASENEAGEAGTVFENAEEEPAPEETAEEPEEAVAEDSGSESGSQEAEAAQAEAVAEENTSEGNTSEVAPADESEQTVVLTTEEAATYGTTEEAIAAVTGQTAEDIKLIAEDTQLTYDGSDYVVYADFGESAKLPEGVQLRVKEITKESDPEAYEMYYQKALSEMQGKYDENITLSFAKFYDIAFVYEGVEIEPSGNVNVRIDYKEAQEIQADANVETIHFDKNNDEQPEVISSDANVKSDELKSVEFESDQFSVYAVVVPGDTSDNARLTVKFFDGSDLIETMYVKRSDLTIEEGEFSTIVYDPGVPDVADNEVFKGWKVPGLNSEDDSYDENTQTYTIEGIRNYIREEATDFKEGDVLNVYAVIFKEFSVTYFDDNNASLGTEQIIIPRDAESVSYTVNKAFTPRTSEQQFQGWLVTKGSENIVGYVGGRYENGTDITITGDVEFSVKAPYGHWLVFDENGKGATYNAPQFVENGEVTKAPSNAMSRQGYDFGGWFTSKDYTTAFNFGNTLDENTTIYAKWNPKEKANYTVIIWKQNVDGNDYDFTESINLEGSVGEVISTVVEHGSGDGKYASVDGVNKKYTGFHLDRFDENVTVSTEGNSILNVYYNRNTVTLTFVHRENGRWVTDQTMTGLYGSSLQSNGYTWPTNRWWYDSYDYDYGYGYYGDGTRTTFLDAFILSDGASEKTFYGFTGSGDTPIRFYKQNADNDEYTLANEVTSTAGTFYITDKYNGFKASYYRRNNGNWNALGEKDGQGHYATVQSGYSSLDIYFDRLKYNLLYFDGVYVDGNGNPLEGYESRGQLNVVKDIVYESDMTSYNKGGANYYEPTYTGFVFEGWYTDDKCTHEYTFSKMPEGLKVYAKWRQVQYRVFLHPNAGTAETEPSLFWGSDSQQMNFRVAYGGKVSTPTGTREDYEFVGWYLDEGCTQIFSQDTVLNDTTVTAEYDKTKDFTEGMDKWGNGATSNGDVDRYWITKKLDLYAKWRAKLVGATGIDVKYDANGGTGAPTDPLKYLDSALAIAQEASQPPAGGDIPQVFKYWVVQRWNGNEYVDTAIHVNPGDPFEVLKANAKQVELPDSTPENPKYEYTVMLRAEYGPWEKETKTEIKWHSNDKDKDGKAIEGAPASPDNDIVHTDSNLKINEAVNVQGKPAGTCYEGYNFLGWARRPNTSDLWLKYEEDGSYTLATTGKAVEKVAADQLGTLPNDVFAIWEKKTYEVTITKSVDGIASDADKEFKFDYSIDGIQKTEGFILKDEQSITIDVPYNSAFALTESNAEEFTMTAAGKETQAGSDKETDLVITINNYKAETTIKGNASITVTNTRKRTDINLKKTDNTASADPLSGAKFELTGVNPHVDAINVTVNGELEIKDLTSGIYKLTEKKAPDGYIIIQNDIYFNVDAVNGVITLTDKDGNPKSYDEATAADLTLTVKNTAGSPLPYTGGPGTLLYTLGGLMLILASALMYGFRMRRGERRIR